MKNVLFLILVLSYVSCSHPTTAEDVDIPTSYDKIAEVIPKEDRKSNIDPDIQEIPAPVLDVEDFYGYYVGMFNAQKLGKGKRPTWENKINISIDKIEAGKLEGHSVVAGNDRPFSGTIKMHKKNEYQVEVKEPGDDKYDGKFSFTILVKEKQIEGKWIANSKKISVIERSYKLDKRDFKYQADLELKGFEYTDLYDSYDEETGETELLTNALENLNPSTQELTKEDVENMYKADLEVMRNSIYAKHGYSFKNRRMRYIFNYVDWYIPVHTDIRDQLTDLEKKNIELIKRYENHADKFYDAFGR